MPFRKLSLPVIWFCVTAAVCRGEKIVLAAGGGTVAADAPATQCALHEPFGAEFTSGGEMIIVEMEHGSRVLKVDAQGMLRVLAGKSVKGYSGDGGPAADAAFNGIHNLAITPNGDILLADSFNHSLRRIDGRTKLIQTFAGDGKAGFAGDGGKASTAQFSTPIQIALDPAGARLFVADIGNRRIRRIELSSGTIATVAGIGRAGIPADGTEAVSAPLVDPRAVAPDAAGGFYILERSGNALRYVDPSGKIRTVAGTGPKGFSGDNGPALAATFNGPKYITLDRDGSVLIADAENHVIRRYSPKTGAITRVAGTGKAGGAGVGGDPLQCELQRPHGVTVAKDGTLFIADSYNDRILKILP